MSHHLRHRARYELKYVTSHSVAATLVERLADVLTPDPHMPDEGGYQVNSVYFDTTDFGAYFEKLDGVDPRYKVRARFYGTPESSEELRECAAFLEVKHRTNQLIHKNRLRIPGERVEALCRMPFLRADLETHEAPEAALVERLILQRPLAPVGIVSYRRAAYVTRINPTLRVTVDLDLRASGVGSVTRCSPENGARFLPAGLAVVEVKFHWAIPLWLLEILRELGLDSRRYSKYASGIEVLYPDLAHRAVRMSGTLASF